MSYRPITDVWILARPKVKYYGVIAPLGYSVRFVACVGVIVGYNNRMRTFSVFEREL